MQFEQSFWNINFGDYSGFDSVCDYIRKGRRGCNAIANFLKARAQIEETYAKQLSALVKNQAGLNFEGSMGKSWDAVVNGTKKESTRHQKLAQVFSQQLKLTNQMTKTLKQKAKQKEEEVRNCQNECRLLYEKALKNKAEFTKRADQRRLLEQEKERLRREMASASSSAQTLAIKKELQKLEGSIRKTALSADVSKKQCIGTLEQLEQATKQWETKTMETLVKYHEMERNRISYQRSLLWKLMNTICETCVDVDKACDDVRNVLLGCDPDSDLQEFISLRRTGAKKPDLITFENLGTTTAPTSTRGHMNKSFKMSISKKLAGPWKLANGQGATADAPAVKFNSGIQKSTVPSHNTDGLSERVFEDSVSGSDSSTAPASPPQSPSSPACDYKKKMENGNNCQCKSPSNESKWPYEKKDKYCIVTRTWLDNAGMVLAPGGAKVKLIEKSTDTLWLIELEDKQTLYCPVEHLQEVVVGSGW